MGIAFLTVASGLAVAFSAAAAGNLDLIVFGGAVAFGGTTFAALVDTASAVMDQSTPKVADVAPKTTPRDFPLG